MENNETLKPETIRIVSLWLSDVERKLEDIKTNKDPRRKTKSILGHYVQRRNKISNQEAIAAVHNLKNFLFNQ